MSNKFTEEQFNTLVRFQEYQYPDGLFWLSKDYNGSISLTLSHIDEDLREFIAKNNLGNEAVAIMNPATRDLSYYKYVEEEKKYYWTTKKKNGQGKSMNLFHGAGGIAQMIGPKQLLTESEIREWGYNPEMFNKEEV